MISVNSLVPGKLNMKIDATLQSPTSESLPTLMFKVFEYWKGVCGDRLAPAWTDFHLEHLPTKAIPWCAVVDVLQSPLDFVYRFHGTARVRMQGRELTGQSIRNLKPLNFADKAFKELSHAYEQKSPVHIKTTCDPQNGNQFSYDILRLPFCNDEEAITQIFTFTEKGPNFHHIYEMYGTEAPTFV